MKKFFAAILFALLGTTAQADVQAIPYLNLVCKSNQPQVMALRLVRAAVHKDTPDLVNVSLVGDPMGVSQGKGSNLKTEGGVTSFELTWTNFFGTTFKVLVVAQEGQPTIVKGLDRQAGYDFVCKRGPDFEPLPAVTIGN